MIWSHLWLSALLLATLLGGTAPAAEQARVHAALNFDAVQPGQQAVLAIVTDIEPGFHAQSRTPLDENLIRFDVTLDSIAAVTAHEPVYPPAEIHDYPALGKVSVYTGRAITYVPLEVDRGVAPGALRISGAVRLQICDDKACFAPRTIPFEVESTIVSPGQPVNPNEPALFAGFDPSRFAQLAAPVTPKITLFGRELTQGAIVFPLAAAFVIGIIFNIMPCVLPVVPLKAIGFYEVSQHHRGKSIALGLVFGLGIVVVFAALGLLVVVLQKLQWGQMFGNPWFLAAIVVILTIFAFSLFGTFNVMLPTSIYRFAPRHDTYTGNFLFGILAAVLSTPCTFGLFLGLLVWASARSAATGMLLLVTVGVGMAFPYLLLSAIPEVARRLPRTGPWAEMVKQMMGFLLLASAVFFARRFLVQWLGDKAYWWALFAVVLAAAVFLIFRTIQLSRTFAPRFVTAILALLLVAPALAFTWRQTNPPIDWQPYSPQLVDEARRAGRIVLLEFTAAWCGNCLALEATVFHDPRTVEAIAKFDVLPIRVDVTDENAIGWKALAELSKVGAIPLTAIYSPNLAEPVQLSGIYTTSELLDALSAAKPR